MDKLPQKKAARLTLEICMLNFYSPITQNLLKIPFTGRRGVILWPWWTNIAWWQYGA